MARKNKKIRKIRISLLVAIFFVLIQINFAHSVFAITIEVQDVINLTNKSRSEAGVDALVVSEKLTQAAIAKANDMFTNQYFDHNSPQGLTPWDFIKSAGYEYQYAGENLAIDFITASGTHKALMESPSHRENILNIKYTEIGIAVIEGNFEEGVSIIIVEEFGAPFPKKELPNISMQKLDAELEERINEINIDEIIKEDIQMVKSETVIIQEDSNSSAELVSNQSLAINDNECFDRKKLELVEIDSIGVCRIENKVNLAQSFFGEKNVNFNFYLENNQKTDKIERKYKLVEKDDIFLVKRAYAKESNFQNQLAVEVNRGIVENELLIKLTFFYTIILFMIMSGTALLTSFV